MKKSNRFMQPLALVIGIWSIFYSTETTAQEHPNSETIRFVLAGDSTVTDEAGWGKGFAELCSENVECINLAASGRSARSYRTEGRWQKCLDAKPDFLLIQFGHNDQPGKAQSVNRPLPMRSVIICEHSSTNREQSELCLS